MDRRYICPNCSVKWFIPASHPHTADLTHCAACGEELVAFLGRTPDCVSTREEALAHPARARDDQIAS